MSVLRRRMRMIVEGRARVSSLTALEALSYGRFCGVVRALAVTPLPCHSQDTCCRCGLATCTCWKLWSKRVVAGTVGAARGM